MAHDIPRPDGHAMPLDSPAWGDFPTVYERVATQLIFFTAPPEKVARLLPAPLEPDEEGLCAAFSVDVPKASSFGPFLEVGVVEKARFRDKTGFYISHLYVTNDSALVCGRELYGSPKLLAEIDIEFTPGNILTATAERNGVRFMTLASTVHRQADPSEVPPLFPTFALKMIPRADGPGPAIKQLNYNVSQDVVNHECWAGEGTIEFAPSVAATFHILEPREIVGAYYLVDSYKHSSAQVLYDYLAEG